MTNLLNTYNDWIDLILAFLNDAAESLRYFMVSTKPYQMECARKKLLFLIFCETFIVYNILRYGRRHKKAAYVYLCTKIYILRNDPSEATPGGDTQFWLWMVLFSLTLLELVIVNLAIVCLAWGNEKGKRIWMRVTPKRKMLESFTLFAYNTAKLLLLFGTYCSTWFIEQKSMHWARKGRWIRFLFKFWLGNYRDYLLYRRAMRRGTRPFMRFEFLRDRSVRRHYYRDQRHFGMNVHFNSNGFSWGSVGPDLASFTALAEIDTVSNMRYGVLFILALSSLTVYSIILAGWSSNSKYAFLGALRSAAQMISYEVSISLAILPVVLLSGFLNLTGIVFAQATTVWFVLPLLPAALIFVVSMLAETNRTPFDLPEAEAELVAGYNVDYSSLPFAMFFLGEYANMVLISVFFCLLFLGGWVLPGLDEFAPYILALKASVFWVFFVLVRATLPRYRYDQLMNIGWKAFLPINGALLIVVIHFVVFCDSIPVVEELPIAYLATSALPLFVTRAKRISAAPLLHGVPVDALPATEDPKHLRLNFPIFSNMIVLDLVPIPFKLFDDHRLKNNTFLNIPGSEQISTELAQGRLQQLPDWLVVAFLIFLAGILGLVYNYKDFLVTIFCVELMYLGAVTSFVLYGLAFRDISASIFALTILIFGACEAAVGLGLLITVFRFDHEIDFGSFSTIGG